MPTEVIGVDVGYRNFAICKIRFEGLRYNRETMEEMPIFTVTHMEMWDLMNSRCLRNSQSDGGKLEIYRIPYSLINPTNINQWLCSLNHFLNRSPWIFEKYSETEDSPLILPRVTVENQCGHILKNKNKKKYRHNGEEDKYDGYDMFRIGAAVETSIHMRDLCDEGPDFKKLLTRVIGKSALKYGIKSDGSLKYPVRKEDSIEITRALLKELGMHNWLVYLDSLLDMKQKIDDICDAILLALQVAVTEYELKVKNDMKNGINVPVVYTEMDYSRVDNKTYPKLLSAVLLDGSNGGKGKIEFEFLDDDSLSEDWPKKRKQKEESDEEPKPKKRKYNKKVVPLEIETIPTKKRKSTAKEKKAPTKKAKKSAK